MTRILILCTSNSCRSQMAQGFLKSFDDKLEIYSAGTFSATQIHPKAVQVMKEVGIDISEDYLKDVDKFMDSSFDFVITICDQAKETCPVFMGEVKQQLHVGFEDPAEASGTEEEILTVFRKVHDEIKSSFEEFYNKNIKRNRWIKNA